MRASPAIARSSRFGAALPPRRARRARPASGRQAPAPRTVRWRVARRRCRAPTPAHANRPARQARSAPPATGRCPPPSLARRSPCALPRPPRAVEKQGFEEPQASRSGTAASRRSIMAPASRIALRCVQQIAGWPLPQRPRLLRAALQCAPVAQLDRASDYESEGRTFESFRARHFRPTNARLSRARSLSGADPP